MLPRTGAVTVGTRHSADRNLDLATSTPIASGGPARNWTGWLGWGVDRSADPGPTGSPPADQPSEPPGPSEPSEPFEPAEPPAPGQPGQPGQPEHPPAASPDEAKRRLRRAALARRGARPAEERQRAGAAIADHAVELARTLAARTVAGYVGVGTEPPSLPALDRLISAGLAVLLPVVAGTELDWAGYTGRDALQTTPLGLLEPVATRLGADALESVDLVLAPALLVDRAGRRLGRGAGYYDRALRRIRAPVYAVVYDDEVTEALPYQRHDIGVDGVLTPSGAVRFAPPGR
jgi:5-formyltetrahydrofolate cyclo-ligase